MAAGCRNPSAANFNGSANPDDYSCKYVFSNQSNCHLFTDVVDDGNRSFTMSYAAAGQAWVFFHDYIPDMYLHSREYLYVAKTSGLFKTNDGAPGTYFGAIKPFFIDVVFHAEGDLILETINWLTEFLDTEMGVDDYFANLTHITVWDSHQHSGRIAMSEVAPTMINHVRKTGGQWSFDNFRDILLSKGAAFLDTIFADYALLAGRSGPKMWYDKELLTDKWFCVRFEFDNSTGRSVMLRDTTIQAIKSDR